MSPESDEISPLGFTVLPDGAVAGFASLVATGRALNGSSAGPLGAWQTAIGGANFRPIVGGNVSVEVSFTGYSIAVSAAEDFEVRVVPVAAGNGFAGGTTTKPFNVANTHETLPTVFLTMGWGGDLIAQDGELYQIQMRALSANANLDGFAFRDILTYRVTEVFPGSNTRISNV